MFANKLHRVVNRPVFSALTQLKLRIPFQKKVRFQSFSRCSLESGKGVLDKSFSKLKQQPPSRSTEAHKKLPFPRCEKASVKALSERVRRRGNQSLFMREPKTKGRSIRKQCLITDETAVKAFITGGQ